LREQLFGLLLIIGFYGLSKDLDLRAQHRAVASVDRVPLETLPPLSKGGLVISHFYLLKRSDMIEYLSFYVNRALGDQAPQSEGKRKSGP
jgi:hypothetical protein